MTQPNPQLVEGLAALRVAAVSDLPHLAWAEGLDFRCPVSSLTSVHGPLDAVTLSPLQPRPTSHAVEEMRLRAAFTNRPPVSARLPFSYRLVPSWLRSSLASIVGRRLRRRQWQWAAYPAWELDLSSDFLDDWNTGRPSPWRARPTPIILSHDLDSAEGLENLVHDFLPVEERVGARSTNFVVPCAWPLDHGLLEEVRGRGHELGIHGYDHSNRTAFLPAAERGRRVSCGAELGRRYGARGYRAPSLLRTSGLLEAVARHYEYDSSIPTSGGPFPVVNNGCASARPFLLAGLVELPLSLPRDGSLLFLGYSVAEILAAWRRGTELIHRSGGVVVLLTHCERRFSGRPALLNAYREFLEGLAGDPRFRWCTAWQVVQEVQSSRPHAAGTAA